MARTHGRIQAVIWSDADFIAMRATAQRMFMFLLSQPDLSHAGLLPMRVNRWAKKASDLTPSAVRDELNVLASEGFVVADEDTEEVLIRTMVRNDGVYKQPKVMIRMREDARQIESPLLRAAFRAELDRLPLDELSDRPGGPAGDQPSTREQVTAVVDALRVDFADTIEYPTEGVSETLPDTPHVRGRAFHLPPTTDHQPPSPIQGETPSSEISRAEPDPVPSADQPALVEIPTKELAAVDPERLDVARLCNHLADRIVENGGKRPTISKAWRDAARLLLDKDDRTEEQVAAAIDWCQADEFWRSNVLSMPKLREKYDQLRLAAQRSRNAPTRRNDIDWDVAMDRARSLGGQS